MADAVKETPHVTHSSTLAHPREELWVKAPEMQGWILKRGFSWRKKWTRRWVVLQNREIAYYEKRPLGNELSRGAIEPRGVATLQRDLEVRDISDARLKSESRWSWTTTKSSATPASSSFSSNDNALDITLYPGGGAPAWELRCESYEDKKAWLRVFRRCEDIASWLVQFQMGGLLGVGAAAVVREVRVRATDEKYALKIVTIHDPAMRGAAVREVEVLQRVTQSIRHPNLITIKKVYQSADKLLIAMPLCSGGELYDRVASLRRFTERTAAGVGYRVLSALRALHSAEPPILHLDVKPENLLYVDPSDDAELLVTDFGLARVLLSPPTSAGDDHKNAEGSSLARYENCANGAKGANGSGDKQQPSDNSYNTKPKMDKSVILRQRMVGTVGYMAPEIIASRHYSTAADIFSTGVVLYTLLVGYPPFPGRCDHDILTATVGGRYLPMDGPNMGRGWGEISTAAKNVLRRLLERDPEKRLTAEQALQMPWLQAAAEDAPLTAAYDLRTAEEAKLVPSNLQEGPSMDPTDIGNEEATISASAAGKVCNEEEKNKLKMSNDDVSFDELAKQLPHSPSTSPRTSPKAVREVVAADSAFENAPLPIGKTSPFVHSTSSDGASLHSANSLDRIRAPTALPVLHQSQDALRELNYERTSQRLSRLSYRYYGTEGGALAGAQDTESAAGEVLPGGLSGTVRVSSSSSNQDDGQDSFLGLSGDSTVINLKNPQVSSLLFGCNCQHFALLELPAFYFSTVLVC